MYFPSANIWLRSVRANTTTLAYRNGTPPEVGDICWLCDSSIIKYLEPMTGDLRSARYADCVFDEDHFQALGGDRHLEECREIEWNASGINP